MDNTESNDEEFHDIEWPDYNPFFDYTDLFTLSPLISAVIENNVEHLKLLLSSEKSININDNIGNTPLHVAVMKDKREVFDYIISLDDVRVDVANFEGYTPLMLSLLNPHEYYTFELINRGASVTLANNSMHTALHYAVGSSMKVIELLIDRGADLDAQNCHHETPLFVACEKGDSDLIYTLLCSGADPKISDDTNILPFTLSMATQPVIVQEILFDYTFDRKHVPISLHTLKVAMEHNPTLFYKLVKLTPVITYNETDLKTLNHSLPFIKPEVFRVFINKFKDVARHLFSVCNCLKISSEEFPNFIDLFYVVCDSLLAADFVHYVSKRPARDILIEQNISEDTLTKVVCCLLSYGFNISSYDVHVVYTRYGFCELFKIMLHMDLDNNCTYQPLRPLDTIGISFFICDINLDIYRYLGKIHECSFNVNLLTYFAVPELKSLYLKNCHDIEMRNKLEQLSSVPSLLELSRTATRKHIILKYNVKNNVHFFTILKWLPIHQVFKDIISYACEIYRF